MLVSENPRPIQLNRFNCQSIRILGLAVLCSLIFNNFYWGETSMKVIGANFAKKVEINNTGKNIVLGYTDKSGKFRVICVDKDLEVWERITEENKFKFGPSMGWGFLGAVILGPIGAIAGILLKGRAKQCTVACVFTESRRCAIEMSPEEFIAFQFAAPAGSDVESIRAEAIKLAEMTEAEEAAEKEAVANAATAADALLKLKQLYDAGILTEEEYAGKREKLMEKL